MKKKALLICSQIPYPCVNGGIERLLAGYESHIFSDFDVHMLCYGNGCTAQMFHYGRLLPGEVSLELLLDEDFAFVILFNYDSDFQRDGFIRPLLLRFPCFQFLQSHPVPGVNDDYFRGTVTQSSRKPHRNVFVRGGFYDSTVFFKRNERSDEFVVCVARIHEDKNQLELVQGYKERIYKKYGVPLYLIGGGGCRHGEDPYFEEVMRFVDDTAIFSNADPGRPLALGNWMKDPDLVSLLHRARLSVMPSPEESFCVALLEALACGTTCVVNGKYAGFQPKDLGPNVIGNVTKKQGSILHWVDKALQENIRLDASAWASKFALPEIKPALLEFLQARCGNMMSAGYGNGAAYAPLPPG